MRVRTIKATEPSHLQHPKSRNMTLRFQLWHLLGLVLAPLCLNLLAGRAYANHVNVTRLCPCTKEGYCHCPLPPRAYAPPGKPFCECGIVGHNLTGCACGVPGNITVACLCTKSRKCPPLVKPAPPPVVVLVPPPEVVEEAVVEAESTNVDPPPEICPCSKEKPDQCECPEGCKCSGLVGEGQCVDIATGRVCCQCSFKTPCPFCCPTCGGG